MAQEDFPVEALQKAYFVRLRDDLEPMDPFIDEGDKVRVYDTVPSDAGFPYVELGMHRYESSSTKSGHGYEGGIEVHVWSDYPGVKEAARIMNEVAKSLTRADLEAGAAWQVIHLGWDEASLDRDVAATASSTGELIVQHGIVRQRLRIFS